MSYVSSAYVPQCLRYGGRPTLSNAHRAHESGVNTDNIRDELDEVITLNSVSIIVAEYIPFGANQVNDPACTVSVTFGSMTQNLLHFALEVLTTLTLSEGSLRVSESKKHV